MSVIIETTVGDITVDLYIKERPRSCLNFLKLCKIKYYNYCIFHSVQRNFVAQTGDPTGTGRGGESIFRILYGDQAKFFDAEKIPKIKHTKAGQISMVNDGNGFHGSQFLLTLNEGLDSLDGVHTVFGEVAEGLDVLLKISEAFCDNSYRPYQDIRITHTIILDDPLEDPQGLVIPDRSPEPTKEQIEGCLRIGADESLEDDEGLEPEEVALKEEKKDASHRAQVLEIIGDLPDKDVKPPDNVLFVCKLNSITTDEDLEIIFSRFGTIISCEVIRDFKTGESLQYAFIEFEEPEMCEKAYNKMDNVLIDDRRIHVDFSQSVSKLQFPKFSNDKEKDIERKNIHDKYNSKQDHENHEKRRNKQEERRSVDDDKHSNKRKQKERPSHERSRDYDSHKRSRDHNSHGRYHEHEINRRSHDSSSHKRARDYKNSREYDHESQKRSYNHESHKRYRDENDRESYKKSRDSNKRSRDNRSPPTSRDESPKRARDVKKSKKHRKPDRSFSGSENDSLSSEKEVRCGKHKKRDVSQHKHHKRNRS